MRPITASSAAASPDAIVALPGQGPLHGVPPALPGAGSLVFAESGVSGAPVARPGDGAGALRNGNPRGNPNLAPPPGQAPGGRRCGAKARTTGCACQASAMANGRCRLHGGKSTGPRTPEGRASVARAHTTHGNNAQAGLGAVRRAENRYTRMLMRRSRLKIAAFSLLRGLPPALVARLRADEAPELNAPVHYAWFLDAPVAGDSRAECPGAGSMQSGAGCARAVRRGAAAGAAWAESRAGAGACRGGGAGPVEGGAGAGADDQAGDEVAGPGGAGREAWTGPTAWPAAGYWSRWWHGAAGWGGLRKFRHKLHELWRRWRNGGGACRGTCRGRCPQGRGGLRRFRHELHEP